MQWFRDVVFDELRNYKLFPEVNGSEADGSSKQGPDGKTCGLNLFGFNSLELLVFAGSGCFNQATLG